MDMVATFRIMLLVYIVAGFLSRGTMMNLKVTQNSQYIALLR